MIKIEKTETYGWEAAIRGMRNPMNSWNKSDTKICDYYQINEDCPYWSSQSKCQFESDPGCENGIQINNDQNLHLCKNDLNLMKRLYNAGTDHRKYLRMITVYCDIIAPLYWWKEFDTYKVGTVANSCSTMHKIQAKEFTLDDFSHEHLIDFFNETNTSEYIDGFEDHPVITLSNQTKDDAIYFCPIGTLNLIIEELNKCRLIYIKTKDKKYWWQMIQLLPASYNQKRTVMMNYEVLANMYKSRKNHKLDEWHKFCDWIEMLPYSELITGEF